MSERHGAWGIEQDDEGNFAICCDDWELICPGRQKPTAKAAQPAPRSAGAFDGAVASVRASTTRVRATVGLVLNC